MPAAGPEQKPDKQKMESLIQDIARAIARAEGFHVVGSLAQRAKNPGNLKMGDVGLGTIAGKTIYPTLEAGWDALYRQVRLMLTGASAYYNPAMTLSEVARIYTGNDNPLGWARAVAQSLGVTVETRLADLLASSGATPEGTRNTLLIVAVVFLAGALALSLTD